mgnify:CR=1 FL=1
MKEIEEFTLIELWELQDSVRDTKGAQRVPFSKEFMSQIHYGILTLTGRLASDTYPIEGTETEWWPLRYLPLLDGELW